MKNKILAIVAAGVTLLGIHTASAHSFGCCDPCNEGWYAAASGSISWHNDTSLHGGETVGHDVGWGGIISAGYIVECWRLEAQYGFHCYDNKCFTNSTVDINDKGDTHIHSLMGNLFYDIPFCDCFSAYLGGGLGWAYRELEINNTEGCVKDSHTNFAWQLMAGFAYDISECWAITIGYRYFSTVKPDLKTIASPTCAFKIRKAPHSNNIDLGARFRF